MNLKLDFEIIRSAGGSVIGFSLTSKTPDISSSCFCRAIQIDFWSEKTRIDFEGKKIIFYHSDHGKCEFEIEDLIDVENLRIVLTGDRMAVKEFESAVGFLFVNEEAYANKAARDLSLLAREEMKKRRGYRVAPFIDCTTSSWVIVVSLRDLSDQEVFPKEFMGFPVEFKQSNFVPSTT